jgi:superfamily I DNA/RNA helicase
VRPGNPPSIRRFDSDEEQADRIAELLKERSADQVDATAVLLPTNSTARAWRRRLRDRGIRSVLLEEYDGTPTPGVKVGTYARSKGLEFVTVFLPDVAEDVFPSVPLDRTDEYLLQGAWLYVAMARARDELLVTYVGEPSFLIQELVQPSHEGPLFADEAPTATKPRTTSGLVWETPPDWRAE